jgi:GNAT superfamily N-acetyltransferase
MEKEIKIKTLDDHIIYGKMNWKHKTDSLIIFVHGLSGYIDDEPFYNAAQFFPAHGFSTIRISLYSYETDARKLNTFTIDNSAQDIETVVNHFKNQFSKIYLIGHSLGGPGILLSNMDAVSGVVLWDPSNPDSTIEEAVITKKELTYTNWGLQIILNPKMLSEWIELRKNVFALTKNINVPLKVICGGKGILYKKWKKYFNTTHLNQEFAIIKKADHSFYEAGTQKELFQETLQFLKKISFPQRIDIRQLTTNNISTIVNEFARHDWPKPSSTFETYLAEQKNNERIIWLAFFENQFAGYITLKWISAYASFKEQAIPEIMDLNVLPPFRNKGIASMLLDVAEQKAASQCGFVGLGVGLYPDYGSAQKLYIARKYKPDGRGITYHYNRVNPGERVCLDDDLVLWLTKKL